MAPLRQVLGWLGNVYRARRLMHRFCDFDDHELRDIGLTRLDLDVASRLPVDADPSVELWRRAERHRERLWADLHPTNRPHDSRRTASDGSPPQVAGSRAGCDGVSPEVRDGTSPRPRHAIP